MNKDSDVSNDRMFVIILIVFFACIFTTCANTSDVKDINEYYHMRQKAQKI